MSVNHQYIELQDKVYKRYIKAAIAKLSGTRVNPHDVKMRVPFLLETPESLIVWKQEPDDENHAYDVLDGRKPIDYDEEVLEIYSPEEDAVFKRINASNFREGKLIEYNASREVDSTVNALTDEEVQTIARIKLPNSFRTRISDITSPLTLERIKKEVIDLNRPKSFIEIINAAIQSLTTESASK